ncbi:MAG TPA: flagellin [Candidatus Bathyarchaeia archaeon]|nr:flagellin [Candidatus Bathyarchaeia archaeon]
MSLVVNTNVDALSAQINLNKSGNMLSQAMQRLSSGLRINSAADDAAGLAISTRLGAQVRGLNQAIRNANDGVAILQTAEGALNEITNIMTRIKELSVQSATGSNSSADRASINAEVQSLISEVTRIAVQTKFGQTALLDGSFNAQFQVGVNAGETVGTSVGNFRAASLGGNVATDAESFYADVTNLGAADANAFTGVASNTTLQITGPSGAAFARAAVAGDDTSSYTGNATSAIATAKVINELASQTGVTASVTQSVFTSAAGFGADINLDGSDAAHTVKINGQQITVNLNGGSVAARRLQFINAVNSQVSGVTASAGGAGVLVLTAADGRNISVSAEGTATGHAGADVFGFTSDLAGVETVVARGGVTLQAGGSITATYATPAQLSAGGGVHAASNSPLSNLDVSTVAGANSAMAVADSILNQISAARGNLGAVQNRLASTVANLQVVSEKVSDAQSRIMDADFAAETAAMTKAQILQQAGIAILSQANTSPEAALALLKR